jgi:hypothetical protein
MKNEIISSEIRDLETQNKKRNLATVTSFLMGGIIGYAIWSQKSSNKAQVLKYVIGGSVIAGIGYWAITLKGVTKRKNAVEQKKILIERGQTKPTVASTQSDTQPTTVVELTPIGTGQSTGMVYKN